MNAAIPGFEETAARELLFTFEDFERMEEAGVFGTPPARVELLEGKFYRMSPISIGHGGSTTDLIFALVTALKRSGLEGRFRVITHATVKIGDHSAPEPDVFVTTPTTAKYCTNSDAVLVIEIAYSTRDTDLNSKRRIYAKAAIQEYWVLEPEKDRLFVFRAPQSDGTYAEEILLSADDTVAPLFAPQIEIALKDLL